MCSWSFPAAEAHRWKCSFRAAKSLWNISFQLPVCAGTSQQLQKGCPCSNLYLIFLLFPYICMAGQFFLSPILYSSMGAPCSMEWGAQQNGWRKQCGCWLSAAYCHKYFLKCLLSSAFWVCFPWAFFHY